MDLYTGLHSNTKCKVILGWSPVVQSTAVAKELKQIALVCAGGQ